MKKKRRFSEAELVTILSGLKLKVVTQDRFMFALKGIEYQLQKYGVSLEYDITTDEKYVLRKLFENRKTPFEWDFLVWGNDDWNGHPWSGFFTLYTGASWCSIDKDEKLYSKFQELFELDVGTKEFQNLVDALLLYSYDKAYTLVLPTPNIVMALNKEVFFKPSKMAILPLWNAKISPFHWSIRGTKSLPKSHTAYYYPTRFNYE